MAGAAGGPQALACYRDSIKFTCEAAAKDGIDILIEPINNHDIPGYLMNDFALAERLIAELKLPNFWLQFDIYHRQRLHGEVTKGLEALLPITRHMQIASAPFRREPTTGELDDRCILRTVERLGYDGYIGCEYGPANGTLAGLDWMRRI
jgi:hydroxypyruvate isomerase